MTDASPAQLLGSPTRRTLWVLSSHYVNLALNIVSGLVLIPLYLRHIDVPTYGAWLATGEVLAWLTMIDPGLGAAVQQRVGMAFGANQAERTGAFAAAGLVAMTAIGSLVGGLGMLTAGRLISFLGVPENVSQVRLTQAFSVALAGTFLMLCAYGPAAVCAGLQRVRPVGIVNVASTVCGMLTTLTFLFLGSGIMALAIGSVARGVCQVCGCTLIMAHALRESKIQLKLSRWALRELVGLSGYSYVGQLAGLLRNRSDALLLMRALGPTVAAQYALTRRLPSLAFTVAERPSFSFMPALSQAYGSGNAAEVRRLTLPLMRGTLWLTGLCVLLLISLNDGFISLWVGSKLSAGSAVSLGLCLFLVIQVPTEVLINVSTAVGKFKQTSFALLAESVVYVAALLVGVKFYGALGAVLALWTAKIAVSAWYFPRLWQRTVSLTASQLLLLAKELGIATLAALGLGVVGRHLTPASWAGMVVAAGLLSLAYTMVLLAASREFRRTAHVILKRLRPRNL